MSTEKSDKPAQAIEELATRYQQLNEKKIRAQGDLQNAQKRLDELKAKARQEYGTDDLEQLKQLLDDRKRENEQARATYQASLDQIESELSEIQAKYDASTLDRPQS